MFATVFNFRDLGGHTGLDGRSVLEGRLFRSDSLSRLTEADRAAFAAFGIRTVLDLRRPYEVARDGRVPEWDGLVWHNIDPNHREWDHARYDERAGVARYLADRYLDLTEEGPAGLAAALAVIADAGNAPLVVHCVAGKDRTGVVAALTLALLGVPDADIATDYALTQRSEAAYTAWLRATNPVAAAKVPPPFYVQTPPEAMLMFLADLRARHGSIERYVSGAGLAPDRVVALRRHLLAG